MTRTRSVTPVALALGAVLLVGCTSEACVPAPRSYEALIRRTAFGVPHIVADDLGSLAFGQGYAFAEDHGCVLADQVLKVRGERARFFGRGEGDAHLDSDFAYRHLALHDVAEEALPRQTPEVRELLRGYVAGYNAFLEERGSDAVPVPCRGAAWVRPLSELDLLAYYVDLTLLGSTRQLLPMIAHATPPSDGALHTVPAGFPDLRRPGMGSNGWAVGGDRAAHGGGLLLGNPHFPWEGELKLSEVHLTIPGELDVYGATLMGVVGVLLGFNERVAWTHTVSFAPRMTLYELTLHAGDPTAYLYDGETRLMTSREHVIDVLEEDGTTTKERRTLWRSHYGPMLQMPLYGWASDVAFTVRDVNLENAGFIEQFRRMSLAGSVAELLKAHEDVQGIPWVHTLAVDAAGDALYTDGSTVPKLSDQALERWLQRRESHFYTRMLHERGAVLLEGDGAASEWQRDERAARPGIVPFEEAPVVVRRDFVMNANDSHWLPHPQSPLEGFSPLYGAERAPLSARTRMNLRLLLEDEHAPLDMADLQERLFSNRGLHAELLLGEMLLRCPDENDPEANVIVVDSGPVDVAVACATLASWDRRYDEDSVGAALFREVLGVFGHGALKDAGALYQVPFDADDPVGTPWGLAFGDDDSDGQDPWLVAVARAVLRLEGAGVSLHAPLGEAQRRRGDASLPVHGGTEVDGAVNIVGYTSLMSTVDASPQTDLHVPETGLSSGGYEIDYGSSFLFTVALDEDGPRAEALLVYGQNSDERSAQEQLELYREKALRPVLFREADIVKDPNLVEVTVKGSDVGL